MTDLSVDLGPLTLRSPLIAASGTVGSAVDFGGAGDVRAYGAMVAKSVSAEPWTGNDVPRMAPVDRGMLNSIGIQNPGVEAWVSTVGPRLAGFGAPVWGSAVGHTSADFAQVAGQLEASGVQAIEVNLSCPESGWAGIDLARRHRQR